MLYDCARWKHSSPSLAAIRRAMASRMTLPVRYSDIRNASSWYFGSCNSPVTPFSSIHLISFSHTGRPKFCITAIMYLPSAVGSCNGGCRFGLACMPVWRYIVEPAFARAHALDQGGCDTVKHEGTAHVPSMVAFATDRRLLWIGVARTRHLSAKGKMGDIVRDIVTPGTVLAEVGERGVDQVAVRCGGIIAEAEIRERPWRRALQEDVRFRQQLLQQIAACRPCDVDCRTLLAGVIPPVVDAKVRVGLVVSKRAAPAARTTRDRLDLDDSGATVRQQFTCPLITAIGQLDHRETLVDARHTVSFCKTGRRVEGG